MEDIDKFYCRWICGTLVAIVAIMTLSIGGCTVYSNKLFVEGGYSMESLPGNNQPQWVKKP
jgi:hypothetical protein